MGAVNVLGIDNIMLAVGDLERARDFYGRVLGLPVKFEFARAGIIGFRLGAEEPGLMVRRQQIAEGEPKETPRVWVEVPDARLAAQELTALGVRILGEPREIQTGWMVEIADPWGNVLGLTDYRKAPARARKTEAAL